MKNSFLVSACVAVVIAVVVIVAGTWTSLDASNKATAAINTANMATQQSGLAMADATEARMVAGRADDKADTALEIANTALQVANNAGRGELTAVVAIIGAVVVILGLFGGVLMLIVYNVRNAHAIDMARLMAPTIYMAPPRRSRRHEPPALPPGVVVNGTVVRARTRAELGEPMYLVRKSNQ